MPSARYDLSIGATRAGTLFASPLQRSDEPAVRSASLCQRPSFCAARRTSRPELHGDAWPARTRRVTARHGAVNADGVDARREVDVSRQLRILP
jgi:hypothetical protein